MVARSQKLVARGCDSRRDGGATKFEVRRRKNGI
jgi:hypothetical protein